MKNNIKIIPATIKDYPVIQKWNRIILLDLIDNKLYTSKHYFKLLKK